MKKNFISYLLFFLSVFILVKCNVQNPATSNYMILEKVEYINEFPHTFSLKNAAEVDPGVIGVKNFCIYDSLLVFSTNNKDGLWSFTSLSDNLPLGEFLQQGDGPYQFIQSPSVGSNTSFFKEKGVSFAGIYDSQKGKSYKMNLTNSIKDNQLNLSMLKESLPPFLFNFIMIDSTTFFCKEINNNQTQQIRYILDKDTKKTTNNLDKLNSAHIKTGEDFNILSTITKLNFEKNLIVEMPVELNYINIYSLDDSFGKTICIGNKLDNIEKIQNEKDWDRMYTYVDLRLFHEFWGVIYINEDKKTYLTERKKHPVILFFNWNGEPIAELKLDRFMTSFDIDFANGYLYGLDIYLDEFYKYDIKHILEQLQSI